MSVGGCFVVMMGGKIRVVALAGEALKTKLSVGAGQCSNVFWSP